MKILKLRLQTKFLFAFQSFSGLLILSIDSRRGFTDRNSLRLMGYGQEQTCTKSSIFHHGYFSIKNTNSYVVLSVFSENHIDKFFRPLVTCQKLIFLENFPKIAFLTPALIDLNFDTYSRRFSVFFCVIWCKKLVLMCVA